MTSRPQSVVPLKMEQASLDVQTPLFFVVQPDGKIREGNPAFLAHFTLTQAELDQGQFSVYDLLSPEASAEWEQQWQTLVSQGYLEPFPIVLIHPTGTPLVGQIHITALRDGTNTGACLFQPEASLAQAAPNGRNLTQSDTDSLATIDMQFCLTAFNAAYQDDFKAQYGIEPQIGDSLIDLLAHQPEAQALAIEEWGRALQGEMFTTFPPTTATDFPAPNRQLNYGAILEGGETGKPIGAYQMGHSLPIFPKAETIAPTDQIAGVPNSPALQALLNTSFQLTALLSPEGKILALSQTALDFSGPESEHLIGQALWDSPTLTSTRDRAAIQQAVRLAAQGETIHYTMDLLYKKGIALPIELSLKPVKDENDKIILLLAEGQFNTAQRRGQAEMMRFNEQLAQEFDTTFEQAAVGLAQVGSRGEFQRINRKYCEILGYTSAELVSLNFADITHPEDRARDLELHRSLFNGEADHFSVEKRYIRKDGSLIWVRLTVARIANTQGKTDYNLVVAEDITERKKTELALQESEERFRILANASPSLIFDMAPDGTLRFINQTTLEFFGPEREEEIKAGEWSKDIHPDDLEQIQQVIAHALETHTPYTNEVRAMNRQGEYRWLLTTAMPSFYPNGEFYGLVGSNLDITERKEAEIALKKSEERFRLLANASPAQIFDMAPDGTMRFINQTTIDFYGPDREPDIMAGNWAPEIHPDDLEQIKHVINHSLETRSAYRAEVRSRRNDGEYRWFLSTSTPSFYSNGDFYGLIGYNLDITPLKEAEFALRESEERFRIMADVSVAHIFDMASDGKIRFINSTMLDFYSAEQIEALRTGDWHDLVHPEDRDMMNHVVQRAVEAHEGFRIEVRFKNRAGQYRWLLSSVEPSFYPTGQLHGLVGSAIDITDIKQAELAARESEERFRIMANASPSHIFQIAPDGTTQFINQTAVDFFEPGTVEAFKRGDTVHLVHHDDAESLTRMIQQALRTHQGYRLELRMKRKDGQYRWLLSSVEPSLYPNGELHSLIGSAIDITEMKMTEVALRESEQRFRIMADASPLQIYDVGPDGKLRYVNKATHDFYGPENVDKLMHHGWLDFVHPEDRERLGKPMPPLAELEPVSKEEFRIRRKDGVYRWVMTYTAPSFYPNGELHGLVGSAIDITERKLMEEALQQSESRWREMANAVPIILWVADAQGHTIFINDRWYQYSGLTPEQSLGSAGMDVVNPDDRELVIAIAAKYIQLGEPYEIESRYRSAQGDYRWHLSRAVPVKDENGKVLNWYGSSLDIQDRRLMELELSKARDIAEEASKKKSQFLANMSHELRTPLNAVIGFSDMLKKGMAGSLSDKQHSYVEHISTSGRHLLTMVNDILDISKAEAGRIELFLQYVELEPFIQQLRDLTLYIAQKNAVQLEFDVQPGLVGLVADPDRLKQIFLNLISNAIKFNHEGGQVNVFLGRSEDYQWVICEIHDTGIGIPPNKLDKLFNEFYQVDSSNARRYEGTGLGLALTKKLVELHHGTIIVESQEDVGSIFTFKLPLNPYAMGF